MMTEAETLASRIRELARALTAVSPAPRGLPHLGLEHPSGTRLDVLAHLASRGIFRKYERVLVPEGGFGAAARYVAARLGCELITTTADPRLAHACALLTARTTAEARVSTLAAQPTALPFGRARFTHVWLLEPPLSPSSCPPVLDEVHRVLRPGGFLALQHLCPASDTKAFPSLFIHAGFVEIDVRDVTAEATEEAPGVLLARAHLLERVADEPPSSMLRALVEFRTRQLHAVRTGFLRVIQLIARRP